MPGRILVIDDDRALCEYLNTQLRRWKFDPVWRTSANEAQQLLATEDFDAVLTDLRMPETDGLVLCARLHENRPHMPVVIYTAFADLATAVAAIRAGAYDLVTKESDAEQLQLALNRAVSHRALCEEVRRLRQVVDDAQGFEGFLGESAPVRAIAERLAQIAPNDLDVLITGESGTGKELLARAIHKRSRRCAGPLVPVSCGALPEANVDSELFGSVAGAQPGAAPRRGLFQEAHGGTLLLDEVADMPLSLQAKLLRVLQERAIRPLGSGTEVPVDVRVIATSNRDLHTAAEEGRFRSELLFRLNVLHIRLPPLRSRGTDVLLLAQHFTKKAAQQLGRAVQAVSEAAAARLLSYRWPGNVRELQNTIRQAVSVARHDLVLVEDLPTQIQRCSDAPVLAAGNNPAELRTLEAIERDYIDHVLKQVDGDRSRAAQILGIDRSTLYRKLKRVGEDFA